MFHFLPSKKKRRQFIYYVQGRPSIKDVLESLGIPHTEIFAIVINGRPVHFQYCVSESMGVEVYPDCHKFYASRLQSLQPAYSRRPRYIADVHLGTLARRLRLLGFDTLYARYHSDKDIIEVSRTQKRIIITRDVGLLKNKHVRHAYFVRATDPNKQIKEISKRFSLKSRLKVFSRCLECNGTIRPIDKTKILKKLPPRTAQYYKHFYSCRSCGKIYWEGSHFKKLKKIIASIK